MFPFLSNKLYNTCCLGPRVLSAWTLCDPGNAGGPTGSGSTGASVRQTWLPDTATVNQKQFSWKC